MQQSFIIRLGIPVLFIIGLASCGRSSEQQAYKAATHASAPAVESEVAADAAPGAPEANEDKAMSLESNVRKIIKTADMRCRVRDVYAATSGMERMMADVGGQISESRMDNQSTGTRTLPYKTDSIRQIQSYTTTAHLTLRVPVRKLDTVLSSIAAQAAFIHSRNLKLDDVTLQFLGNRLRNEAAAANDAAERARMLARRSSDAVSAGQYTDERDDQRIQRRLENMGIQDQVTYATLQVDLYQPERIDEQIVPDMDRLMKPSFGQQVGMALSGGWQLLQQFLVWLVQVWPILLAGVLVWLLFRFRKVRRIVPSLSK